MTHFDAADAAVEAALAAGARNADIEDLTQSETAGIGVRALVGGCWGFFAVPDLDDARARAAGVRATEIARASAAVPNRLPGREALIASQPETGSWASECLIDPLSVPLSDKGDLLTSATAEMRKQGADIAAGSYDVWDTRKWFVSS